MERMHIPLIYSRLISQKLNIICYYLSTFLHILLFLVFYILALNYLESCGDLKKWWKISQVWNIYMLPFIQINKYLNDMFCILVFSNVKKIWILYQSFYRDVTKFKLYIIQAVNYDLDRQISRFDINRWQLTLTGYVNITPTLSTD